MSFVPTSTHGQTPASTLFASTDGRLESLNPQNQSHHVSSCYVMTYHKPLLSRIDVAVSSP